MYQIGITVKTVPLLTKISDVHFLIKLLNLIKKKHKNKLFNYL